MEAYISQCPNCGAVYPWVGYKTGVGKTPEQLKAMKERHTICKMCKKPGLETDVDWRR